MRVAWRRWVPLLLALPMIACGLSPLTPTPTAPPFATDVPTVAPPTVPPTDTPTPTPIPLDACPLPASPPPPEQPADFASLPYVVQQYLSAGADVAALEALLEGWNVLIEVAAADLTANGRAEVIVVAHDPASETFVPATALFVYGCREGAYVLQGQDPSPDHTISLAQVEDVTGDETLEIVYIRTMCGAHTCYESLGILGWDGRAFYNLMDDVLELPHPTYTVAAGRIEARSGGIGSVGAEPQEYYTEVWTWNGHAFVFEERIYAPAVYRYHVLLEGERALEAGDLDAARAAYQRVIDDDRLEEWSTISGLLDPVDERAQLTAFAHWRLMLIHLLRSEEDAAEAAYDLLVDEYLDERGHPVAAMAETFWDAYEDTGQMADGCAAVVTDAQVGSAVLDFFNQAYGYANPWWEPLDLCWWEP